MGETRRRSAKVRTAATAAFAVAVLTAAGCGSEEEADMQATCHNAQGERVDDDYCDDDDSDGHGGGTFIFWPVGSSYPAHGQSYRDSRYAGKYKTSVPAGSRANYAGANRSGGTATKTKVKTGGFGGTSVSKGGGGAKGGGGTGG